MNEEDCSISNVGSSVDNSLCMSEQDSLSYVDVASIGDFDNEDSIEDIDIFWRTVFRWVARMSYWPTFIEEEYSRLFRSLGQMCVLDVHVGQTDVPTGSPGDFPWRSFPPSPMSPGGGELVSSQASVGQVPAYISFPCGDPPLRRCGPSDRSIHPSGRNGREESGLGQRTCVCPNWPQLKHLVLE